MAATPPVSYLRLFVWLDCRGVPPAADALCGQRPRPRHGIDVRGPQGQPSPKLGLKGGVEGGA